PPDFGCTARAPLPPYSAHLVPHSFPTRRSSDLAPAPALRGQHQPALQLGDAGGGPARPLLLPRGPGVRRAARGREAAHAAAEEPDRKSTRLNSSHQIISYAVSCLKRKTHPPLSS